MPFFWGLQLGLDVAAAGCAVGLFSLVRTIPGAVTTLAVIGTTYLVWLAYRIATAPVRGSSGARKNEPAFTAAGGFLLGVTNPKAYLAFVSLMSSQVVVRSNASADVFFKWLAIAVVIVVVDMVWLWIGAVLGRSDMGPRGERTLNVAMGSVILGSSILAWV
jgi:threonine/homoserine/homoserine lactone efflux protein